MDRCGGGLDVGDMDGQILGGLALGFWDCVSVTRSKPDESQFEKDPKIVKVKPGVSVFILGA
jgi:hypothetical protein